MNKKILNTLGATTITYLLVTIIIEVYWFIQNVIVVNNL